MSIVDKIGKKEWIAKVDEYEILVRNSWLGGATLVIDGEERDTNNDMLRVDKNTPMLKADLGGRKVEVFVSALVTVKAKICVDGEQIGGDVF